MNRTDFSGVRFIQTAGLPADITQRLSICRLRAGQNSNFLQFYISSLYVNTCVCRGLFQVVSYFEWSACNRQGHFGNGSLSLSTKNLNLRIQEIDLSRKTWNKFILFCLTTFVDWIHYLILPRIKIPF